MSLIDDVRAQYGPREDSKSLGLGTDKTDKRASVSSVSPQGRHSGILADLIDLEKTRQALAARTEARERRRRIVLERLEANPALTHAFFTDDSADPVIVACAVRGIGTAELSIDRERWDPFRFLEASSTTPRRANDPEWLGARP